MLFKWAGNLCCWRGGGGRDQIEPASTLLDRGGMVCVQTQCLLTVPSVSSGLNLGDLASAIVGTAPKQTQTMPTASMAIRLGLKNSHVCVGSVVKEGAFFLDRGARQGPHSAKSRSRRDRDLIAECGPSGLL